MAGHMYGPDVFRDCTIDPRPLQIEPPPIAHIGRIYYMRVRVREALDNGEYVVASCNKDGSNIDGARTGYFVRPAELIAGPVVKSEMEGA